MTMSVVASGSVVGDPVEVGTEQGSMAVFVLAADACAPHQAGPHARAVCEVLCRSERLKDAVLHALSNGEKVVVVGQQHLLRPVGPTEDDLTCATVQIEARTIGIDINRRPAPT